MPACYMKTILQKLETSMPQGGGEQLRLDARMFVYYKMEHSQLALMVMKLVKQSSLILV